MCDPLIYHTLSVVLKPARYNTNWHVEPKWVVAMTVEITAFYKLTTM